MTASIENLKEAKDFSLRMVMELHAQAQHIRDIREAFSVLDGYITDKFYPLVQSDHAYEIMGEVQGVEARLMKIVAELVELSKSSEAIGSNLEIWL